MSDFLSLMAAATSRTRSDAMVHGSNAFAHSFSSSSRFLSGDRAGGCGRYSSPSAANAPYTSSFTTTTFAVSRPSALSSHSPDFFHQRSASPTRVNLVGSPTGRPVDPIAAKRGPNCSAAPPRKTCMCSPTTHPGSFRCSLHKGASPRRSPGQHAVSSPSNRLNARRSAMTNSLVRIGTVEGEWVKRALTALIRPSSHQQRRRTSFHAQLSRLSVMSKAEDLRSGADASPI